MICRNCGREIDRRQVWPRHWYHSDTEQEDCQAGHRVRDDGTRHELLPDARGYLAAPRDVPGQGSLL